MKRFHVPDLDTRYWAAITLASVFGTNLGDLYAHESGLGIGLGLLVLAAIAGAGFLLEARDRTRHEAWYWLIIIVIRTGATNIADFLASKMRVPPIALVGGLGLLFVGLAWRMHVSSRGREGERVSDVADTAALYWTAMLTAGVLGTVMGDHFSHLLGKGPASLGLLIVLLAALWITRGAKSALVYWAIIGIARTAGTSIGDLLADDKRLDLGLPLSTLLTGLAFVLILVLWRGSSPANQERRSATV